jgi:hypothetical protein
LVTSRVGLAGAAEPIGLYHPQRFSWLKLKLPLYTLTARCDACSPDAAAGGETGHMAYLRYL